MNPSRLKDRATIQTRAITTTNLGVGETWLPEDECAKRWCRKIPLSAMERLKWQQANAQATHRILFRVDPVLEGYAMGDVRFLIAGKTFTLHSVAKRLGGNEDFLEFMCLDSAEGMSDPRPAGSS